MNVNNKLDKPFHVLLDKLMQEKGLKISQLSYKTGLSATYLSFLKNKPKEYPPTKVNIEAIAKALDVKPERFREYRTFKAKEVIERDQVFADEIAANAYIKIVGYAPASTLGEAIEMELGHVPTYVDADFAVIARGDCLENAGISDGDVVMLKKKDARDGDIALIRYNGEVTLKYYHPQDDHALLKPASKDYPTIKVTDFEILGVAVGKFSRI